MLNIAFKRRFVRVMAIAICVAFAGGLARAETLRCTADYKGVYHDLTVEDKGGAIVSFSYISSVKTPGLATNCTVDDSAAQGAPVQERGATIYHMIGDDVITIKKNPMGWLFDMTKLTTFNYCNGILARQITIDKRKSHCRVASDGAPVSE